MTYYKQTTIFVFAALLMALPLVNSNAFGDGDSNLDPSCGVTVPGILNLGSFSAGADGIELVSVMATGGPLDGTLEVTAGDWLGVGTLAKGTLTLNTVIATDAITLNGLVFTAVAGAPAAAQFQIGGTDAITATNLATAITSDARTGITVATQDQTAEATGNVVIVRATVLGTTGNSIDLVSADATIVANGATLLGAEATGVTHMESTATKFAITTDGTSSAGTAYSAKTAFDADTVLQVMTSTVDPANDVSMALQISGVGTLINLPYSGALTQTLTFTVTCI